MVYVENMQKIKNKNQKNESFDDVTLPAYIGLLECVPGTFFGVFPYGIALIPVIRAGLAPSIFRRESYKESFDDVTLPAYIGLLECVPGTFIGVFPYGIVLIHVIRDWIGPQHI